MTTRREFLSLSAAILAAQAGGLRAAVTAATNPLDILFLGGTGFLGPHQINYAIARGHRVTMFNRGTNAGMFGDAVEELVGNRDDKKDNGLAALEGERTWDFVVDNSGYVPRHVRDSVELLKGRAGRYIYVSTLSVYDFDSETVFPESAKLADLDDPSVEEVTNETYGPLKAECDRIVREIMGDSCTVVRPTYVVGPGDNSDRFTYWVERVHRGGDVLAPSGPGWEVQWVDVMDLCPWIVTLGESDTPGIFNAAGPSSPVDRQALMWGLRALTAEPVNFNWPGDDLLEQLEISLPMMPLREGTYHFDNTASMAAGLHYRSLADTASATLEWWQAQPAERRNKPRWWPSAEKERKAIDRLISTGSTES
jgi:2'-hydroxyisoflavone reductase